jgi:hypothetical protein
MKTRIDETNKMRKLMGLNLLTESSIPYPQFGPLIGKTAIFKPIKDTTKVIGRDGSVWHPGSEYGEKLSDIDAETLEVFTQTKVNGVIKEVLPENEQEVEISLEKMVFKLSTGLPNLLKRIIYHCGERKFELIYSAGNIQNYNPETKRLEKFAFEDASIYVDATCDSLADYLESVLPCDGGHDFVKGDTELDIIDTLT